MTRILKPCFVLLILSGMYTTAYADGKYNEARGQLLYSTYCNVCHTSQVHWRDQKKVTDWSSLVKQVRRWQNIAGLGWTENEINDVSFYLNSMFYAYKNTAQGKNSIQYFSRDQ